MRPLDSRIAQREGVSPYYAVVTGVSASGKDLLLKRAKFFGYIPRRVKVIDLGDELFAELKNHGPSGSQLQTKDDIRNLDPAEVNQGIWGVVGARLYEAITSGYPAILNAHVVYRQGDELVSLADLYRILKPASYTFVWSNPDEIYRRRQKKSRRRPQETPEEIAHHQVVAYRAVKELAESTGADLHLLVNVRGYKGRNLAALGAVSRRLR